MAGETVRVAARRIAEHASRHRLSRVDVVLHGGEPLLMGLAALRSSLAELSATIGPAAALHLRLQTNGVLLSEALCDLFVEFRVGVGVSLDGDRRANDRHRRFAGAASSYDQALRALALLRRRAYRPIYSGILCTIDVENDPIRTYEALLAQEPPRIDLLLPHATWDRPPRRPDGSSAPYGDWLRRVYERWLLDGRPVPIRLFDSLLSSAAGGPSGAETVGLDPADVVVIETDGAWEQADSMKAAFDGAPATGLNVFTHTADEVAAHPQIARRQAGLAGLCPTCRNCPVVRQCGGGLFAHRFRTGHGFDNPSVYCADLKQLVDSMNRRPPDAGPANTGPDREVLAMLDDIGSGYGGQATLDHLAEAELSITRALVVAVAAGSARTLVGPGWDLLGRLDRDSPAAVRSVLAHPFIRMWAMRCLNSPPERARPHAAYLCCVAAAAAVRAGASATIAVPVRDGRVHLPTLGSCAVTAGGDTAVVSTDATGFTVRAGAVRRRIDVGAPPAEGWQPVRHVVAGALAIAIEDGDPYRDCHDFPATGRLSQPELRAWEAAVAGAWRDIQADAPGHIAAVRSALRAVVPLVADAAGTLRSATARHAYGAIGASLPTDPGTLAPLLVHEVQHTKLGAVQDLVDLVEPAFQGRLRVGWRPDPRPLEAVLQGTYAHLGVADVWRARAARPGPGQDAAAGHFRRYRGWTIAALAAVTATGALSRAGERLVDRMRETMESWP